MCGMRYTEHKAVTHFFSLFFGSEETPKKMRNIVQKKSAKTERKLCFWAKKKQKNNNTGAGSSPRLDDSTNSHIQENKVHNISLTYRRSPARHFPQMFVFISHLYGGRLCRVICH